MKIDLSQFDGMTPGPWEVDDILTINGVNVSASVYQKFDDDMLALEAESLCRGSYANARAIAALPELIDELRNTESERAHHAMTAGCLRTDLEYANAEIAKLKAALYRAREYLDNH